MTSRAFKRLRRRWDRIRAPWPMVGECHSDHIPDHACEQCQPTHAHVWREWANAPGWVTAGPGIPVRCKRCGARKCDVSDCQERRHDRSHWERGHDDFRGVYFIPDALSDHTEGTP